VGVGRRAEGRAGGRTRTRQERVPRVGHRAQQAALHPQKTRVWPTPTRHATISLNATLSSHTSEGPAALLFMRNADDPWLATLRPAAGGAQLAPEDFAARFLHEGDADADAFDGGDDFDEAGPPEFQPSLLRCCALLQARLRAGAVSEAQVQPGGGESSPLLQAPPPVAAMHAPLPRQQQQHVVCGFGAVSLDQLPELGDDWETSDVFTQPPPQALSAHVCTDSALLAVAEDGRARRSLSVLCVSDLQLAAAPLQTPRCLTVCLRHCSCLGAVSLVRCPFLGDPACWRHVTAAVAQCPCLRSLAVCRCALVGEVCLPPLAACLLELSGRGSGGGLHHLSLAFNDGLGDTSIGTLAEALVRCPALATLRLAHCGLGHAACHSLSAVLSHPGCGLTHLDVGFNPAIGTAGAILADVLAVNTTLRRLAMPGCALDAAAARPLARGLRANWTTGQGGLTHLSVASNALGHGMGSAAMCDALGDAGARLEVLDVSHNGADDTTMRRLAAALRRGLHVQHGAAALVLRCGGNPGAGAALEAAREGELPAGRRLRVEGGASVTPTM
jgi:hypothetical protein